MMRFWIFVGVSGVLISSSLGILTQKFLSLGPEKAAVAEPKRLAAVKEDIKSVQRKKDNIEGKNELLKVRLQQVLQKLALLKTDKISVIEGRLNNSLSIALQTLRRSASELLVACQRYDVEERTYRQQRELQRRMRRQHPYVNPEPTVRLPTVRDLQPAAMSFANAWREFGNAVEQARIGAQGEVIQVRMEIINTLNEVAGLEQEAFVQSTEQENLRQEMIRLIERIGGWSQVDATDMQRFKALPFSRDTWRSDIAKVISWIEATISAEAIVKKVVKSVREDPEIQAAYNEIQKRGL